MAPPPPNNKNNNSKKKKQKGPTPAHQNTFAFSHNAKSKKTAVILASPNVYVCRRCHDKIEWRKRYRKYKPRTQPGICNACQQRNVYAAYHTICDDCTIHSDKAKQALQQLLQQQQQQQQQPEPQQQQQQQQGLIHPSETQQQQDEQESDTINSTAVRNIVEDGVESVAEESTSEAIASTATTSTPLRKSQRCSTMYHRICAMCVKEPAIYDDDKRRSNDDADENVEQRRLRLRERKTIQRQQERLDQQAKQEAKEARRRARLLEEGQQQQTQAGSANGAGTKLGDDYDDDDEYEDDQDDDDDTDEKEDDQHLDSLEERLQYDDQIDDDDPFLKAVGGVDKLLIGEAYQQKMLEESMSTNEK